MKNLKVFSAPWCSNCKTAKMMLDKNNVKYDIVDCEEKPDEFEKEHVQGIPVFIAYENGNELKRWNKFDKGVLEEIKATML